MDFSEFKKKDFVLVEQIDKLKRKRLKLKQEYLKTLPVQVDDRITYNGVNYWVSAIELPNYSAKLNITVNPMKKDGTRGTAKRILWGVDANEVEVIQKCGRL